jgi:hypothetical protein
MHTPRYRHVGRCSRIDPGDMFPLTIGGGSRQYCGIDLPRLIHFGELGVHLFEMVRVSSYCSVTSLAGWGHGGIAGRD